MKAEDKVCEWRKAWKPRQTPKRLTIADLEEILADSTVFSDICINPDGSIESSPPEWQVEMLTAFAEQYAREFAAEQFLKLSESVKAEAIKRDKLKTAECGDFFLSTKRLDAHAAALRAGEEG